MWSKRPVVTTSHCFCGRTFCTKSSFSYFKMQFESRNVDIHDSFCSFAWYFNLATESFQTSLQHWTSYLCDLQSNCEIRVWWTLKLCLISVHFTSNKVWWVCWTDCSSRFSSVQWLSRWSSLKQRSPLEMWLIKQNTCLLWRFTRIISFVFPTVRRCRLIWPAHLSFRCLNLAHINRSEEHLCGNAAPHRWQRW